MFDEKNVYIRQAEVKGSFKQNSNGTFLIGELTVNSSLKNYKTILHKAFEITLEEINLRNTQFDKKEKEKSCIKKKDKKTDVKGLQ